MNAQGLPAREVADECEQCEHADLNDEEPTLSFGHGVIHSPPGPGLAGFQDASQTYAANVFGVSVTERGGHVREHFLAASALEREPEPFVFTP
jgi:hypothetical protein